VRRRIDAAIERDDPPGAEHAPELLEGFASGVAEHQIEPAQPVRPQVIHVGAAAPAG
jgi:hypothetical protein